MIDVEFKLLLLLLLIIAEQVVDIQAAVLEPHQAHTRALDRDFVHHQLFGQQGHQRQRHTHVFDGGKFLVAFEFRQ
jgi:hypothetical protein